MRRDPGPCPICGAAHAACTTGTGPITVTQFPARDAMTSTTVAEQVQTALPEGSFTSGTYRRKPKA